MTFDDLNSLGEKREPFLFISDFGAKNLKVIPLGDLDSHDVEYSTTKNYSPKPHADFFDKQTIPFSDYKKKFDSVIERIKAGDTYLLNLTQPTNVKSEMSLKEMFQYANARYKLRYRDEFVCFSPEQFVSIKGTKIATFPMKGTIDASIPNAKELILNSPKEMAEHVMVVDLLRNDLSIMAKDVKVEEFRYITKIEAGDKELLHVSSHISGDVGSDWHAKIGDILKTLLPAGSISGAPKKSTLDIIDEVEGYERGYFSGVFGVYDGKTFDSAVMIRFVEKTEDGYIYKSGGGITLESDAKSEYEELLNKVYLP
ncbi:aminodeoxychorismate synthase component I [Sulfurimonas sp.]|uniref:aminodeoxychorismate synthase component I n=1 Tax=Sulfurimonas sp. TaxID=2022749 RepID=UPI0019F40896|nr:aminodeoxychorismate synthase component I [Sulfurimonas sp.]MBE0514638.1 aminodeoxychorismate synthase component I [Sulfurimonas sp.]